MVFLIVVLPLLPKITYHVEKKRERKDKKEEILILPFSASGLRSRIYLAAFYLELLYGGHLHWGFGTIENSPLTLSNLLGVNPIKVEGLGASNFAHPFAILIFGLF